MQSVSLKCISPELMRCLKLRIVDFFARSFVNELYNTPKLAKLETFHHVCLSHTVYANKYSALFLMCPAACRQNKSSKFPSSVILAATSSFAMAAKPPPRPTPPAPAAAVATPVAAVVAASTASAASVALASTSSSTASGRVGPISYNSGFRNRFLVYRA